MTTTSTFLRSSSSDCFASVTVRWTGRAEGDLIGDAAVSRRRLVHDGPWSWCRQVHGRTVHVVEGAPLQNKEGDALVTATPGTALAVFTADCAPVALASREGVVGIAHAGWRGVEAGVIEAAAQRMRDLGATDVEAVLGPCIRPCCYAFGEHDLARLERSLGSTVRGTTRDGEPALDLPAAVTVAVERAGASLITDHGACTGCGGDWFSYRVRGDSARQATVIIAPAGLR